MSIGIAWLEVLLIFSGGFPHNLPPLPEDSRLVSVAPDECLFYLSWYGTAEARADSANRTERLMAEAEVQHFTASLWATLKTSLIEEVGPQQGQAAAQVLFPLVEAIAHRPGVIFVQKVQPPPQPRVHAAAVVSLGDARQQLQPLLVQWEQLVVAASDGKPTEEDVDGVKVRYLPTPMGQPLGWGIHEDYLFVVVGDGMAEQIIGKLKSPRGPPAWLRECIKQAGIERPALVQWLNLRKVLELSTIDMSEDAAAIFDALGLTRLQTMESVAGLDGDGLVSRTSFQLTPGPAGIFGLLPDQPLTANDLAQIPADSTLALAVRLDAAETYRRFFALANSINPEVGDALAESAAEIEEELGFELEADLLQPLGDRWTLHSSPGEGSWIATGVTAQVSLRDPARFSGTLKKILALIARENGVEADAYKEMRVGDTTISYVNQEQLNWPVIPAWCVVDDTFIVSASPQTLRAHLSLRSSRAKAGQAASLASNESVATALQQQPVKLFYVNTRELLHVAYPAAQVFAPFVCQELRREGISIDPAILPAATSIYPHAAPSVTTVVHRPQTIGWGTRQSIPGSMPMGAIALGAGLAMPVAAIDELSPRYRDGEAAPAAADLKQVGRAMHAYAAGQGRFPAPANLSADGKPLLSWRVHLLPYLDQQELYEQFRLDEPWDSEHNKKLVAKMPAVFAPSAATAEQRIEGKTRVVLPVGEHTMFPLDKRGLGVAPSDVSDGLGNTIMVLQTRDDRAVPWTRPLDHNYDADDPTAGLFEANERTATVVLGDGSVWNITRGADHQLIQAMFTRNGNEPQSVATGAGLVPVRRGR